MATEEYIKLNKANWDERAPQHAKSPDYDYQKMLRDPTFISGVVQFDLPLLGNISDLEVIHLQCHIATDTLSLARLGARSVTGLDFSPAAIKEARHLAATAAAGERLSFVEAPLYDALKVLSPATFDLVFTGIGALCWLPNISQWAQTVAGLLKPAGRLFIREGHPIAWAIDERNLSAGGPVISWPYFEREAGTEWNAGTTYVDVGGYEFRNTKTVEWNHGLGEIVQALLDAGLEITGLVEHRSLPWCALPGQMVEMGVLDEWVMKEGRDNIPLSYTLQARKK